MRHRTRAAATATLLSMAALLPLSGGGPLEPITGPLGTRTLAAETTAASLLDPDIEVQPDIFVVLLDDHAYLPDQRVLERLPNTSRVFLQGGMRFEQMHNETPLCSPSRAALLTGQHTLRHGVVENDGNPMDPNETIAVALDEAGYHTAMVGKWLNRWEGSTTPPGWDDMAMAKGAYQPAWFKNGERENFKPKYVDEAYGEQVAAWTREAPRDQPLFMLASVRAPHVDQCVNDKDQICYTPRVMKQDRGAAECADIPDFKPPSYSTERRYWPPQDMPDWPDGWKLGEVCESLLVIDRLVGDMVEAQAARERPAYFVFLSDNGMAWGQHGNPFKRVPWSTRMPFYVAGPGIEPGSSNAELQTLMDLTATIADLGGAELPWADGESFVPVLAGEPGTRHEMLEVQEDRWTGIRTDDMHYVRWADGETQLWAYRDDPWLLEDLSEQEPELVAELDARMEELLEASRA